MLGRSTLFIPEGMMQRIDTYRGELSRVEFLEFCIGTALSEELRRQENGKGYPLRRPRTEEYPEDLAVPSEVAEEYVARKEFEDLMGSVRELATLKQTAGESVTKKEFEEIKQSIRELAALKQAAGDTA